MGHHIVVDSTDSSELLVPIFRRSMSLSFSILLTHYQDVEEPTLMLSYRSLLTL
jgi:hypothetical protein